MGPVPGKRIVNPLPIFDQLRTDHAAVLARTLDVERAIVDRSPHLSSAARGELQAFARHLERQFATHLRAEDEVLYPTLAARLGHGSELVQPLHREHAELRAMLACFTDALARGPGAEHEEQLIVQLRDLIDLLRIHIRKEETLVFGLAERVLEDSDRAELEALRRADRAAHKPATHSPHTKGTP
jgi:hemerythrin-like domain-containing protein